VATLVFGVGYIGSRLVQDLLYEGRDVVGFDNYFSSDRRAVDGFAQSPAFRFVEGSISDESAIERAVDVASGEVDAVYLEVLARRGVGAPVVYGSSLRVHGSPLPALVDEKTPYGTFTDLAHLSKVYVEELLEMFAVTHGLTSRAVRLGLTYGVAPVMKVDRKFMTAPNLFCYLAATGEPLEVRNDIHVGLVHVDDAARSLRWAADTSPVDRFVTLNAPAEVWTVGEVAECVRLTGEARELNVTVRRPPFVAGQERNAPRLISAMTAAGFVCQRRLVDGLAETLDHFLVKNQ
jgi:nucleoside-diphosphate-sugar epimerase